VFARKAKLRVLRGEGAEGLREGSGIWTQKGEDICMEVLHKHTDEPLDAQAQARRECRDFYALNLDSLLFDVVDQLDRTVNKYDFNRL